MHAWSGVGDSLATQLMMALLACTCLQLPALARNCPRSNAARYLRGPKRMAVDAAIGD